ncbi:MAG: hypothetical protein QM644_19120, partial [Mobilitalea sp.]
MMLIYDILDGVREKPALYMGNKNITSLKSFLDGAVYASHILGIDDGYNDFSPIPFRFFNDYVALFYNYVESTSGWLNMILNKNHGDEQVSFDIFYTLLDNFRSIDISKIQKCVLTQEQINSSIENEYAPKRVLHNDCNQMEPLFINPKSIYLIELSNNLGYLCMIECNDAIFLHSFLLASRQSAIEYFKSNFGGSYHWYLVESIPEG